MFIQSDVYLCYFQGGVKKYKYVQFENDLSGLQTIATESDKCITDTDRYT